MLMVNTDFISGRRLETIQLVRGNAACTVVSATCQQQLAQARQEASGRMMEEAASIGADAVINVRCGATVVTQGMVEILVYGTAVRYL